MSNEDKKKPASEEPSADEIVNDVVKLTNSVATKTIAISARLFDSAESAIHRMMGSSKAADAAPVEAQPAEAPTQPAAEEKPSYAAAVAKAEPIEEDFVEAPGAAKK